MPGINVGCEQKQAHNRRFVQKIKHHVAGRPYGPAFGEFPHLHQYLSVNLCRMLKLYAAARLASFGFCIIIITPLPANDRPMGLPPMSLLRAREP
jgi:hypothetical protein